jgi:hypothetical protein
VGNENFIGLLLQLLCVGSLKYSEIIIMGERVLVNGIKFAIRLEAEKPSNLMLFNELKAEQLVAAVRYWGVLPEQEERVALSLGVVIYVRTLGFLFHLGSCHVRISNSHNILILVLDY